MRAPLLRRLTPAEVQPYPFPHIVKENALDEDLYAQLVAEFPPTSAFTQEPRDGLRYDLSPSPEYSAQSNKGYSDLMRRSKVWGELITQSKTGQFVEESIDLFRGSLEVHNPRFLKRPRLFVGESRSSIAQRLAATVSRFVALTYVTMNIATIPRGPYDLAPHHDTHNKLFSLVLYLRHPEDWETEGGSLCLWAKKRALALPKKPPPGDLEPYRTVEYQPNTIVMFINNRSAYYSVSRLQTALYPRNFVYLGVEVYRYIW